ncbi:MAG: hypothetical protein LUC45_00645, partial [Paraprevotella sp.]|nr:hypothetical protein [Paraprevotella sp.]
MKKKQIFLSVCLLWAASLIAPAQSLEMVARIMPPNPDMSGIAITPDGRIFLGFPRHADNHDGCALAELKDGR